MSRFLRVLAWIAPQAALSRAHAQALLAKTRDYDGATTGRRGAALTGRATSANTEVAKALRPLRDRSRDLARNTWIGARVLDVLVGHLVGHGINPRWNTGNRSLDKRLARLWREWVRRSDIEGELDFHGQVALAVRSMLEGGDALVRMVERRIPESGGRVPLAIQVMEGDHLDDTLAAVRRQGDARIKLGIEFGDWNERVAYHLFPDHPGEYDVMASRQSVRVERRDLCHLYRPLRAGQIRGVPVFAPALMAARDHASLVDALVIKAEMEAVHGLIYRRPDGSSSSISAATKKADASGGETINQFRPGMTLDLPPGYEVTTLTPTGSGAFGEINIQVLMGIAVGTGITYDQLTGDFRQANYSSLKKGAIEFRRHVEQIQWHVVVPMLIDRVVDRWIETAILAGLIRPRAEGYPRTYVMPAVEPLDAEKELKADVAAVRAGRMSPQEFIESWGRDYRDVIEDFRQFFAEVDAVDGLSLDIDPRRSAPGSAAPAAKPEPDPDAPDPEDDPKKQEMPT